MKSKRNLIISFLLCACLIVGVGYATLVDQLTVNGTLAYTPENAEIDGDVGFYQVQSVVNCSANIGDTPDTVIMEVNFNGSETKDAQNYTVAEAVLVIANESTTTDVTLGVPTDFHNENNLFIVSVDWLDDTPNEGLVNLERSTLNTISTTRIKITVKAMLTGSPQNTTDTFIVQLPVTPVS